MPSTFTQMKLYIYIYIYIYILDIPHLIKPARNCLAKSAGGQATRYMWNNGYFIIMNHIAYLYYENKDCGLKLLLKLTNEHFKLT